MQVQTIPLDREAAEHALLINAIYAEIERQGGQPTVALLWRALKLLVPFWWRWP